MSGRRGYKKHREDKANMRPQTSIESKRLKKQQKKQRKKFLDT